MPTGLCIKKKHHRGGVVKEACNSGAGFYLFGCCICKDPVGKCHKHCLWSGGEASTEELMGKKGKCPKVIDKIGQHESCFKVKKNTSRNSKSHAINFRGFQGTCPRFPLKVSPFLMIELQNNWKWGKEMLLIFTKNTQEGMRQSGHPFNSFPFKK